MCTRQLHEQMNFALIVVSFHKTAERAVRPHVWSWVGERKRLIRPSKGEKSKLSLSNLRNGLVFKKLGRRLFFLLPPELN